MRELHWLMQPLTRLALQLQMRPMLLHLGPRIWQTRLLPVLQMLLKRPLLVQRMRLKMLAPRRALLYLLSLFEPELLS